MIAPQRGRELNNFSNVLALISNSMVLKPTLNASVDTLFKLVIVPADGAKYTSIELISLARTLKLSLVNLITVATPEFTSSKKEHRVVDYKLSD